MVWMSAQIDAKLGVFGGAGLTGRQLLAQALGSGMKVRALAREPAKLAGYHGSLEIVEGTVTDPATVERVVSGCSAVISTLGRVKDSPEDLLTVSSVNMVAAMKKQGVRRVVVLTNSFIDDSNDHPPFSHRMIRRLLSLVNSDLVHDSVPAARVITDSGLDWTLVRAPVLTNGPRKGHFKAGPLVSGIPLRVSRADVADFMLSCVSQGRFVHERPAIGG